MKKLLVVAAMGAAGLMSGGAHAASTSANFNVEIFLTPVCSVAIGVNPRFDYTAGTGGTTNLTPATGTFNVTCTSGVAYTFSLVHVATGVAPAFPVTDFQTQIAYSIQTPAPVAGTGGLQNYTLTGDIVGPQAGACPGGVCNNLASPVGDNKAYQLVVNY